MNVIERFGNKVIAVVEERYPRTYFVGGFVRDTLLKRKITDIDIATEGTPEEVIAILDAAGIANNNRYQRFGVTEAVSKGATIEITTLRRDLPGQGRYPKIRYIRDPKQDSLRRDFTINALYLHPRTKVVLDYHYGREDIRNRIIRFIGSPQRRITEDPLRIVRAYRFALTLDFSFERNTERMLQKFLPLTKTITASRLQKEIDKINSLKIKKQVVDILRKKS